MVSSVNTISNCIFLSMVIGIPLYGTYKKVNAFDAFVDGAKQGFDLIISILPFFIAMITALGMLKASGFFTLASHWLAPVLSLIGMPSELLPLALVRPFSGSASTGIMAELIHDYGGNSYIAKTAATMMSSTETTFTVIAIYFGVVCIKKTRYAIPVGLLADLVGIIASVVVCHWLFD